jgi:hypothetical protein
MGWDYTILFVLFRQIYSVSSVSPPLIFAGAPKEQHGLQLQILRVMQALAQYLEVVDAEINAERYAESKKPVGKRPLTDWLQRTVPNPAPRLPDDNWLLRCDTKLRLVLTGDAHTPLKGFPYTGVALRLLAHRDDNGNPLSYAYLLQQLARAYFLVLEYRGMLMLGSRKLTCSTEEFQLIIAFVHCFNHFSVS